MNAGACSPEELEMLLEDALLLRDGEALAALFDEGAVLATGDGRPAHGNAAIARAALAAWDGKRVYLADPRRITQARDIALIVAEASINIARRDRNGAWRYAIVLVAIADELERRHL
jgi:hypothetical protein